MGESGKYIFIGSFDGISGREVPFVILLKAECLPLN